jgi:hypothetical protein
VDGVKRLSARLVLALAVAGTTVTAGATVTSIVSGAHSAHSGWQLRADPNSNSGSGSGSGSNSGGGGGGDDVSGGGAGGGGDDDGSGGGASAPTSKSGDDGAVFPGALTANKGGPPVGGSQFGPPAAKAKKGPIIKVPGAPTAPPSDGPIVTGSAT